MLAVRSWLFSTWTQARVDFRVIATIVFWSLCYSPLVAEDVAEAAPAQSEEPNFSRSLSLVRNRDLEQSFRDLDHALASPDAETKAVTLLANILQQPADIVWVEERYRDSASLVSETIRGLTPALRNTLERLLQTECEQEIQAAFESRDVAQLQRVALKYRDLRCSVPAWKMLARIHADRGEVAAARYELQQAQLVTSDEDAVAIDAVLAQLATPVSEQQPPVEFHLTAEKFQAVWESRTQFDAGWQAVALEGLQDLRENGIHPLSNSTFHTVPQGLLVNLPQALQLLNQETGAVIWSRPHAAYGGRQLRTPPANADMNEQRLFEIQALHRIYGHSAFSKVTLVGNSCWLLERDVQVEMNSDKTPTETFPQNRLLQLDLTTGEVQQHVSPQDLNPFFFTCAPTLEQGVLYVMGDSQATGGSHLLGFDAATGQRVLNVRLGNPLFPFYQDARRHEVACPVTIADGLAICPTAAGAILAVDLYRRQVVWGHRYPRNDGVNFGAGFLQPSPGQTGYHWWSGWQQVQTIPCSVEPTALQKQIACVSPEGRTLDVLDLQSGRLLSSVPREDGLFLCTADPRYGIVIVGREHVRAVDLNDGAPLWKQPLPLPAGYGLLTADAYLLPTEANLLTRIDLHTGSVANVSHVPLAAEIGTPPPKSSATPTFDTLPALPTPLVSRNLAVSDGKLVVVSPAQVTALAEAATLDSPPAPTTPDWNLVAAIDAELARGLEYLDESGQDDQQLLELWLLTVSTTSLQNADDLGELLLQHVTQRHSPGTFAAYVPQLLAAPRRQALLWREWLTDRLAAQDWPRCAQMLLQIDEEVGAQLVFLEDDQRRCQLLSWLKHELELAALALNSEQRTQMQESLLAQLETAQRWQWRALPDEWQAELVTRQSIQPPVDLISSLAMQLAFPQRTGISAAQLAVTLIKSFTELDQPQHVHRWRDLLRTLPEDLQLPGGESVAEVLAAQQLAEPPPLEWPTAEPTVTEKARRFDEISTPLPVSASRGSMFSRLNIDVDWPSWNGIRFSSADRARPWGCYFPRTTRALRRENDLAHGWAFEQMLVLQVGSEVFGIAPTDFKDRRSATLLWPQTSEVTIDTLGDRSNILLSFFREHGWERPGFVDPPVHRFDQFNHRSTAVGPVRSTYFCIQQKGMLVAFETLTGKELWRRYDLPPRATCLGDDQHVAVASPVDTTLRILDKDDGRLVEQRPLEIDLKKVILQQGGEVILSRGDRMLNQAELEKSQLPASDETASELSLRCFNVITQTEKWSRTWPAGSLPFQCDEEWLGVLTAEGMLEFVDRQHGTTIVGHPVQVTGQVERIACCVTHDMLLVAISGAADDSSLTRATQRFHGYRRPIINGQLYAFSRTTGKLHWDLPLPNCVLPLDQPLDLPVFITCENRYLEGQEQAATPGSRFRCYNRQTGQLLFETESTSPLLPQYGINGNLKKGTVTLTVRDATIVIDFSPEPPPSQAADDTPP